MYISIIALGFPGGSDGKESVSSTGDLGLIPGLRRSPGEGHSNPLQYACLVHSVDRGALAGYSSWVAKNQVQLSNYCFFFFFLEKLSKIINMKSDKDVGRDL